MSETQLNHNIRTFPKRFKKDVLLSIREVMSDPDNCGVGRAYVGPVVHDVILGTATNTKRYGHIPLYLVDKTIRAMAAYGKLDGWVLKQRAGFVHKQPVRNCAKTRKQHALLHQLSQLEEGEATELFKAYFQGIT